MINAFIIHLLLLLFNQPIHFWFERQKYTKFHTLVRSPKIINSHYWSPRGVAGIQLFEQLPGTS